jgi:hypothetical protein
MTVRIQPGRGAVILFASMSIADNPVPYGSCVACVFAGRSRKPPSEGVIDLARKIFSVLKEKSP